MTNLESALIVLEQRERAAHAAYAAGTSRWLELHKDASSSGRTCPHRGCPARAPRRG